jgi:hypothetical protein
MEKEEADLTSRIDFITRHRTLFAADFELALDIVCNLDRLYEKGNLDERRLLAEALLKKIFLKRDKIVDYELNPPFGFFYNPEGLLATPEGPTGSGPRVRYESLWLGIQDSNLA